MKKSMLTFFASVLLLLQFTNIQAQVTNIFPTNGNAGIGTLTPTADLEIIDSKIPHFRVGLDKTTRVELGVASANHYFATQAVPGDAVITTLGTSRNLIFNTADSPGKGEKFLFVAKYKNLLTVTDNARVGIGTHNPTANLDVKGNAIIETENNTALTFKTSAANYQLVRFRKNNVLKGWLGVNNSNFDIVKENEGDLRLRVLNGADDILLLGGNVGINTSNPTEKLHVNGSAYISSQLSVCGLVRAKEVKVEDGWCDYVFDESYQLPTLEDEAQFIEENGHLSSFESAEKMDGEIKLGDVTKRQQETIEKLMLHMIEMDKEIKELKTQIEAGK